MSDIVKSSEKQIPAMSDKGIELTSKLESFMKTLPQEAITTEHSLHAGVYSRTIKILEGVVICGALIKRSTNLVISGHVRVSIGNKDREYKGYAVIAASANRKQAFVALEDTYLTMYFSTKAVTIEEAEEEFTDEFKALLSRVKGSINHVTITGE